MFLMFVCSVVMPQSQQCLLEASALLVIPKQKDKTKLEVSPVTLSNILGITSILRVLRSVIDVLLV